MLQKIRGFSREMCLTQSREPCKNSLAPVSYASLKLVYISRQFSPKWWVKYWLFPNKYLSFSIFNIQKELTFLGHWLRLVIKTVVTTKPAQMSNFFIPVHWIKITYHLQSLCHPYRFNQYHTMSIVCLFNFNSDNLIF